MNSQELKSRAVYVTKHGSYAYGLNTPTSDLDIKGVLVGTKANYLGFLNRIEQLEEHQPNDLVIYEIQKFFKLAADCNPNIIEVLHTDPGDIIYSNYYGQLLASYANDFLSQKAKFTFSGYAMAQMKRMKSHAEWMQNPPTPPRIRSDLGLPPNKNWCAEYDRSGVPDTVDRFTAELYQHEKMWRKSSEQWTHYQEWLTGRNEKRHELEVKFGYDTKHGMHLVRLMRMGHEILTTGKVIVKRPDREELLAIRNHGIWSYDKIMEYATDMDTKLTELYRAGKSPLPKEPDRKKLDQICASFIQSYWEDGNWSTPWDGKIP